MKNIVLRPWRNTDTHSLVKYANNYNIWKNVRDSFPHPYTYKDAEIWVRVASKERPSANLAISKEGEAIGGIGLKFQEDIHRNSVEIGYWLGEAFWGKGIITEALTQMITYTFENFKVHRLYAGIFEYNKASGRVLEKAGFQFEGIHKKALTKNNQVYDEYMYGLVKQ